MEDQTQAREILKSLTEEVSEVATYLRELGVETLEGTLPSAIEASARTSEKAKVARPPAVAPALRRNANAERPQPSPPEAPLPPPKPSTSTPRVAGEPPAFRQQTAMPKKPVRKPSPDPPAPRETLFGDITPADDLSLGHPGETFEDIRRDVGECVRCPLHQGRTHIVHTEGSPTARLLFVGEAPGADEDATGRPFVGRAGQLLNKIIEAIGLKRDDVLIGNVNRCRPPANRTPTTEEARTCKPFLLREINVARPDVIVVLGNTAMKNLLDTKEGITRLRGEFQDYKGIKVMPTFHPAYLLRDPSKKREVWADMKKVRDYLNSTKK
ncbi:MAG: uracil-DNA glycosylase [Acidobacteria bacterium]|nr:MAG: uracil-DNA glycosylase [Acidobacteriota bacterium]